MKPSTGDILAMASYPDYDLNNPFTPSTEYWRSRWDSLSSTEKTEMYRNINISTRYEPGSTFKLINASIALEEDITKTDIAGDFNCQGFELFSDDVKVKCWSSVAHGPQTLRQVLENSCNPGMMQLAKRIGTKTLYKYYKAFGLFDKTGVQLPEEVASHFHAEDKVGPVELATMSFGQRIKVNPLQLITSTAAIANNGVLMQPRIVKEIVNTDTNAVTNIDPVEVRQVISSETATKMLNMMESVVLEGTGSSGSVRGYSVGGKTGTSEPPVEDKDFGYVASFIAVSPAENPEIIILVAIYDPQVKNYHGGTVSGPVISGIFSEVLPYLGISPDKVDVSTSTDTSAKTVPNIVNKTVTEAEKVLTNSGFRCEFNISGNKNEILVTDQVPAAGIKLPNNSLVMLYTAENNVRTSTSVPDLSGMSSARAANSLKSKNLNISIEGKGIVSIQEPAARNSS